MTSVTPVDFDGLPAYLQEIFRPRVERLGYLGDWFRFTAHQPRALQHFHLFTEELKDALDPRLVEVVALTVAARLDNRYERHQHEQLSRKRGYPDAWVRAVVLAEDVAGALTREERAVRGLAESVTDRTGSAVAFEGVVDLLGEKIAVGLLLLCARYVAHAAVAQALELRPPVSSTLEPEWTDEGERRADAGNAKRST